MNFDKYIFRSHMVGKIIDVPKPLTFNQNDTLIGLRSKEKLTPKQKITLTSLEHKLNESKIFKLSDATKKTLNKIVFYEKTGRVKILEAKYLDKGLAKEKDARDLMSEVLDFNLIKDDERKSNDFVTGQRDIKHDEIIIDIKSSWSYESFNNLLIEKENEVNLRQMDSYMDLWKLKESIVAHVLVDTPINLINDELRRLSYKEDIMTIEGDIRDEAIPEVKTLLNNMIFTRKGLEEYCQQSINVMIEWFDDFKEVSKKERIHMIPHSFDNVRIEQRNECIKLSRKYMNTVKPINNIINI
ncbi:MAG: hypothetical protein ACPGRW_06050 [Flavobacteriaceae bacterium]